MAMTVDELKEYFDRVLAERRIHMDAILIERSARNEERHKSIQTALTAALDAANQATAKAEAAAEKRFESVNEFRATLDDQQRTLMPRAEVEAVIVGLRERLEKLEASRLGATHEQAGVKAGYVWAIGAVGIITAILSIAAVIFAFVNRGGP